MNTQTKLAIIAIVAVIPLVSIAVYQTTPVEQPETTDPSQLKVISSFYPLHEFSQSIGKDRIDATLVVPVGIEPHDWEPTVKDMQTIQNSDLVIINGIGFETWVDDLRENGYAGTIVDTSDKILIEDDHEGEETKDDHDGDEMHDEHEGEEMHDERDDHEGEEMHDERDEHEGEETKDDHDGDEMHDDHEGEEMHDERDDHEGEEMHDERDEHEGEETKDDHDGDEMHDDHEGEEIHDDHDHSEGDPHIWLNPVYAKVQVQTIADAFSDADPENGDFYQSNADDYIGQLDDLDSAIRDELHSCNTDFIAFHDAFSHFASEYGLHQHTIIQSLDPHGDATAKTLERVISLAKELNIKVVFTEELVNPNTAQVIADEIGGRVMTLSPLETVSDGTYVSKMTQNLENLKEALC